MPRTIWGRGGRAGGRNRWKFSRHLGLMKMNACPLTSWGVRGHCKIDVCAWSCAHCWCACLYVCVRVCVLLLFLSLPLSLSFSLSFWSSFSLSPLHSLSPFLSLAVSLFSSVSLCLYVSVSLFLWIFVSFCLHVPLSLFLCVSLSLCLCVPLSLCISVSVRLNCKCTHNWDMIISRTLLWRNSSNSIHKLDKISGSTPVGTDSTGRLPKHNYALDLGANVPS